MNDRTRGSYVDLQLLGEGGMASVYRARDPLHNATVALKALRFEGDAAHRELRVMQFHREFRTLKELAHPRVIQVFDYGVDELGPYYTMELLDGADLMQRAPLHWRECCSLLRDVSSSLVLLHSRGFVHRDISPVNIRCTEDGRAKLIDFGAMMPMGMNAIAMGTPPCAAPEVLTRQPLDGRTDLYALGATLYYSLTRRHAYPARTFSDLRSAHERPVQPPSRYASDVPHALDRLVLSLGPPQKTEKLYGKPSDVAIFPRKYDRCVCPSGCARAAQVAASEAARVVAFRLRVRWPPYTFFHFLRGPFHAVRRAGLSERPTGTASGPGGHRGATVKRVTRCSTQVTRFAMVVAVH